MADKALQQVIAVLGSKSALARCLGITPQAIQFWERVPADRVLAVEAAVQGRITRHEMRPDVFGNPPPDHQAA